MDCQKVSVLLELYIGGDLPKEDSDQIANHISQCQSCSKSAKESGEWLSAFARSYEQLKPPTESENRLISRMNSNNANHSLNSHECPNHPVNHKTKSYSNIRRALAITIPPAAVFIVGLILLFTQSTSEPPIKVISGNVEYNNNFIRTSDSKAVVQIRDKSVIRVNENTEIKIEKYNPNDETLLELTQGSASFEIVKQAKPFSIKTNAAEVNVLGTKFSMSLEFVNSKGEKIMKSESTLGLVAILTVLVESGSVEVSNMHGKQIAKAGNSIIAKQDKTPEKETKCPKCRLGSLIEKDGKLYESKSKCIYDLKHTVGRTPGCDCTPLHVCKNNKIDIHDISEISKELLEHFKACKAYLHNFGSNHPINGVMEFFCKECGASLGVRGACCKYYACKKCAEKLGICDLCGDKLTDRTSFEEHIKNCPMHKHTKPPIMPKNCKVCDSPVEKFSICCTPFCDNCIKKQENCHLCGKSLIRQKTNVDLTEHLKTCKKYTPKSAHADGMATYSCSMCSQKFRVTCSCCPRSTCNECCEKYKLCPFCGDEVDGNIRKLIEDLASNDAKVVGKAIALLVKIGLPAIPHLDKTIKKVEKDVKWIKGDDYKGEHGDGKCCKGHRNHSACLVKCNRCNKDFSDTAFTHQPCQNCAKELGTCYHCNRPLNKANPETYKDLLKQVIERIMESESKVIDQLLQKLDDDDAKERDKATEKLIELGKLAYKHVKPKIEEQLKKAQETKNIEVTKRCEYILDEIGKTKSK